MKHALILPFDQYFFFIRRLFLLEDFVSINVQRISRDLLSSILERTLLIFLSQKC